jgi:hypothetical protein
MCPDWQQRLINSTEYYFVDHKIEVRLVFDGLANFVLSGFMSA